MASDDEDEELAALRFAALASMKSKQRPLVKEDDDLKALKEAALRSLEQTEVISSGVHKTSTQNLIPAHLQQVQPRSPNYYSSHPPPPVQYVHTQYTQPPPIYPPPQALQAGSFFPQFASQHVHHPSQQQIPMGIPTRDNSSRSSASGPRGTGVTSEGRNTPPVTASGGTGLRGAVLRGNPPKGPPKRGNNLIVISPMGAQEAQPNKDAAQQSQSCPPRDNSSASKQMLLRPQDKWCSSEGNSTSTSPQRPKATGKFSRFDSSSESDESESEEEPSPVNMSVETKEASDTEQKASDNDQRVSDNDQRVSDNDEDDSKVSESKEDSENDENSIQSVDSASNVSKDSSESESSDSEDSASDSSVTVAENPSVEKKSLSIPKVAQELETEEEKFERRETHRMLEEAVDQRHVLTSSSGSDNKLDLLTASSAQNVPQAAPSVSPFDLAHKLAYHRALTKKPNSDAVMDLSEKLKHRRNQLKEEEPTGSGDSSLPEGYKNITIQTVVEDDSEKSSTKMSEETKRLEARKRKFESSPVPANKEGKKTISLKGIVPRSKKRMKERRRSASPVPKCYSRDLQRYEKKHGPRVRHKSGSKENREQKKNPKLNSKEKTPKKQEPAKKESDDSSDSSVSEEKKDIQLSDDESDEEDRSWRKRENENKLVISRERNRPIRDHLDSVRVDSRRGRDHRERGPRDQDYNRRPRFENSRTSRNSRLGESGSGESPRFAESGSGASRRIQDRRTGDSVNRHKDSGRRPRSVEVVDESESDSDGPRLPSSIVLPSNKSLSNIVARDPDPDDDDDDNNSNSRSRSRSPGRSKTSRKVTKDERKTLTLKTRVQRDSRDRSPLSVTIDKESRSSVHKRLGRQLETSVGKLKLKSGKERPHKKKTEETNESSGNRFEEESPQADDDLEQRIQKIKAKNAAILKRQEEVRQDKERYG